MTTPSFKTHKEARAAGWFSRRHRTDEAHRGAREKYKNRKKTVPVPGSD